MAAIAGYGTTIEYGAAAATPVYATLANPREIELAFGERMTLDATALSDHMQTMIAGRTTPGEIVVTLLYDNDDHKQFLGDLDNDSTPDYYAMQFKIPRKAGATPTIATLGPFVVFVRSVTNRISGDDVLLADVRFQIVRTDEGATTV